MRPSFDELAATVLAMFMVLIMALLAWSSLNSTPQQESEDESKMVRSMPLTDEPETQKEFEIPEPIRIEPLSFSAPYEEPEDEFQNDSLLPLVVNEYDISEADINYLAKTLWGEARGIESTMEKAAVCWCVLNRVDSEEWDFRNMNTIESVVTAPNQFMGYDKKNPLDDELVEIASDVLTRWYMEKDGIENVGRVLPKEYTHFYGDGESNYFRTDWRGKEFWDWSLEDPYKEETNGTNSDESDIVA